MQRKCCNVNQSNTQLLLTCFVYRTKCFETYIDSVEESPISGRQILATDNDDQILFRANNLKNSPQNISRFKRFNSLQKANKLWPIF